MRISIITVCLNRVDTIERTVQSVINQNYNELEYIIIDGGSSDGTVDIIKKYEPYITYWVSETDYGIYDAMNKGIAKSSGDVVAFLNSDDWYEDDTLCRVNDYFNQYDPMILSGKQNIFQKKHWIKQMLEFDEKEENIRIGMNCRHPATFVKRALFDRFGGFNTKYKIAADYEWMLRMYDNGIRVMKVDDVFTNFSSKGVSSINTEQTIREAKEIALSALNRNNRYNVQEKEEWRRKIHELYDGEQDILEVKKLIRNNRLGDRLELKYKFAVCFTEKVYAIWGRGIIGEEAFSLLSQIGLSVKFFIDSHIGEEHENFHGLPVKSPQTIDKDTKIIVASIEYEDEIVICLKDRGFGENTDYVTYSKLLKRLAAAYRAEMGKRDLE